MSHRARCPFPDSSRNGSCSDAGTCPRVSDSSIDISIITASLRRNETSYSMISYLMGSFSGAFRIDFTSSPLTKPISRRRFRKDPLPYTFVMYPFCPVCSSDSRINYPFNSRIYFMKNMRCLSCKFLLLTLAVASLYPPIKTYTMGISKPTIRYHLPLPPMPCLPLTMKSPERAKKINPTANMSAMSDHPPTRL